MLHGLALSLVIGATTLFAQGIPDRPEKLTFPTLNFQVPKSKDFKAELKNGIPVFLAPDPKGPPMARLTVTWRGGAYLEPKGKEGLANFFGSQLVLGGTSKLSPEQLEDKLEGMAASLSSNCGNTSGSISLQVLDKDLPDGLELLTQALLDPAFAPERLEIAKRSARQAMERRNDSVTSIVPYQMNYLLFGENHFAANERTAASQEAVTQGDLKAFHAKLLHPSNFVIHASGNFERKALLELLNKGLGSMKAAKDLKPVEKVPAPNFTRQPGIYVSNKVAPQSMVQWAFPGIRRTDADWHAGAVMNHILGGSFTSRLMKKIRSDEGLTYGVRTALGEGAHWRGDLTGGLQTQNRTVAYALRLALAEMQRLKEKPLTEAELSIVKNGLIEAFPAQWSGKQAIMARMAEEQLLGWPKDWWVDYRQKVQAVTPADVQRLAKKVLDFEKLVVFAAGTAAEIEAGDPDHPGALKDVCPLPLVHLPLRDPLTLKPQK